ncbi:hypothetical protein WME95_10230 [Sorangium sp. So ce327]|uniref:hypothetical protein n=1 Tax=Sorangium sp. So ce327 TaxID=3133301 RepID=UPI003F60554E
MTLRIAVTWPNANSPLLPDNLADVRLEAGGTPLTPKQAAPGRREYEIPDGAAKLSLKASFSVAFGPVKGTAKNPDVLIDVGAMTHVVLRAEQEFDVVDGGTRLRPVDQPAYAGPHPLVHMVGAANLHAAVSIKLRTEFVDITPFWKVYAAVWSYYEAEHKPGTTLLVLGATGATPIIWFASIPDACLHCTNGFASCLIFFRPENYIYTQVNQPHQMAALARYLLKPKEADDATAQSWERDYIAGDGYNLIRCGFEDALARSQRAVVMLHPWPSGTAFGGAAGSELPALCSGALRLLWADQHIFRGTANVRLGRLGISGFSRGGGSLWPALASNIGRVDEVYAFDCVGTDTSAGTIVQWYNSRPEARLRMVGGAYNVAKHQAIYRTIQTTNGVTGPLTHVTAIPESNEGYAPRGNPLWDHVLKEREDLRSHPDTRHQFAIFGGYIALPGPFALTFLLRFLKESLFMVP